jgi:crossover junction endodeoxyribonuclease RusA
MTETDSIHFCVYGTPAAQGSKKHVGNGVMIESSKALKPWRESVKWAAREHGKSVAGAVRLRLTFTMVKPKSAPKKRVTLPDKKPDLDKLQRGVFDSLTQAGVIDDDARIVHVEASKVFPGEHELALDVPGVRIEIQRA